MSKFEHDARAASARGAQPNYDKPWFHSVSSVLAGRGLKGLRCLDLCAGNGEFAELLRDRFNMRVTCADYAPAHLERSRSLGFETLAVNFDDDAARVDELARTHRESFDIVTSLATIEHVFDSDNLLRFAHHVLKPGGVLIVNTPNISFLGYRLHSLFNGNRPFGEAHHVRFWDFRFLRTNLFLNGFDVEGDHRAFYSLPEDPLARAFRGHHLPAWVVAQLFRSCRVLQHLPPFRGLFTDELTVLARKVDVFTFGCGYLRVKTLLSEMADGPDKRLAIRRLQEARSRGWLDELLNLAKLADSAGGEAG